MSDNRHLLGMLALLVSSQPDKRSVFGRALIQLISDVEERSISVLTSESLSDAKSILSSDPAIQCVLLSWEMDDSQDHHECINLLTALPHLSQQRSQQRNHHQAQLKTASVRYSTTEPEMAVSPHIRQYGTRLSSVKRARGLLWLHSSTCDSFLHF